MSSTAMSSDSTARIPLNQIVRASVIAAITAMVANIIVFYIASALGFISTYTNPQLGRPIGVGEVIGSTIAGTVGATVLFALLARFTRRPVTIFRIVAAIVLVVSFATPFSLPGAPLSLILTLALMHIVAAAVIVGVLTTRASAS